MDNISRLKPRLPRRKFSTHSHPCCNDYRGYNITCCSAYNGGNGIRHWWSPDIHLPARPGIASRSAVAEAVGVGGLMVGISVAWVTACGATTVCKTAVAAVWLPALLSVRSCKPHRRKADKLLLPDLKVFRGKGRFIHGSFSQPNCSTASEKPKYQVIGFLSENTPRNKGKRIFFIPDKNTTYSRITHWRNRLIERYYLCQP